jgi:hypothetical protein
VIKQKGKGGDGLKDLGHQLGPVMDRGCHVAGKDPVEFGRVYPGVFDVVDFEPDVGGDERGLGC